MRRKFMAVVVACALVCAGAVVGAGPVSALDSNPTGNFEAVVRAPGGLRVSGWAFDFPDTTASIEIRDRLLRTAEQWEARARGIDHPGR